MLSDHRIDVTYGLYALKNFLADNPISIPLNEASRNEIQYCVLQKDQVKARAEYEDIRDRLKACAGSEYAADFEEISRRYATSTHHTAALVFGAGTVEYSVLWIEKSAEVSEPEPEPTRHFSVYGAEYNRTYVRCDCGWGTSVPTDITATGKLELLFGVHLRDAMIDAEVTPDA